MPHTSYQPVGNTANQCNDRYSSTHRSASRSVPYNTQQRSVGRSGAGGCAISINNNSSPPAPPLVPAAPSSSSTPPSSASSSFLSLEPASPSVFASYPTGWQSSTAGSYWPTVNPISPVGKWLLAYFYECFSLVIRIWPIPFRNFSN